MVAQRTSHDQTPDAARVPRPLVWRAMALRSKVGRRASDLLVALASSAPKAGSRRLMFQGRWDYLWEAVVARPIPPPVPMWELYPDAEAVARRARARREYRATIRRLVRLGYIEQVRDARPWDPGAVAIYRLCAHRWP